VENRAGARFCNGCGTALAATCASCGQGNPTGSQFCDVCGQALTTSAPTVESTPTPPQSYTPRHLAEKILAGRAALEGERKQVTVLFADVVGSTALIRDRDPEESQRMLDGAVQQMMTAVHQYEGTVSRLLGDGLMAMFGAPVSHEDHAARACYAALAMLDACRAYAEDVRQSHGASIQIRVGLNSGEVIVRLISDDLHLDYTAMGQTVHLASRMEQLAPPGTVLLAPTTLALVEGLVETRPLGPTAVKGLDDLLAVHELVSASATCGRLQAASARGLTPFVGRVAEFATIDRALVQARAGRGQVVALVAEPGVGKSRLLWEATRSARITTPGTHDPASTPAPNGASSPWLLLEANAFSYFQSTSWLPVIGLLEAYCQVERSDDHQTTRQKVADRVLGLDPSLRPDLPALLALLNVPNDASASPEQAAWDSLDPPRRRRQTLDGIQRLLFRASQDRPLLLVFEDLHWIDSETQTLLDELVERLPATSIALLVSYRPEYQHSWGSRSYYTQIRVDPLPDDGAAELLAALLGSDPTVQPLAAMLAERTAGNPFFLEESVRTLVETGALVGEPGGYRLVGPADEVRVPATVQAVLSARIDRLSPADKRLLQTSSVVGKDLSLALVRATAELPDDKLQSGLARLQTAELLYRTRLFPDPEYTFKHALTHEVAYASLLQDRKRALHARVVEAIEQEYPDRLDEHVDRLAHHALRGELWEKAVSYCRQAGRRALSRSVPSEAGRWFEQALTALHRLPETPEMLEQSIDLRINLRSAPHVIDHQERAHVSLTEAQRYAEKLGDERRLGRVLVSMNSYLAFGNHLERAMDASRRALAIGEQTDDLLLQAAACQNLGQNYHTAGQYQTAIDLFREGLARMERESVGRGELLGSSTQLAVHTRCCIAWSLSELGDFATALAYGRESVEVADEIGSVLTRMSSSLYFGMVCNRKGDYERSVQLLERAYDFMEMANISFSTGFNGVTGSLGTAYFHVGRVEEAIPLLEQGWARSLTQKAISDLFIGAPALAEAYLEVGRPEAALSIAQEAVGLAREQGKRGFLAWQLHALAQIQARRDPPDLAAAEGHYQEAMTIAEVLGMRPLQAHCHLSLGRQYRQVGRRVEARAELSTAVTMLREMGMTHWLPEAEAELAQARAPASGEPLG